MRLGDLLIRQDVLTEEKLKKALELQKGTGKKIGEVLVENGFITEEMIARALQTQLGLKIIELTGVTIPKEVRNLVSVNLLKKYQCIPFELDPYNANILHLAMSDPMDMAAIDDISIVTNLQVEPYIATPRDILAAIDRCYGASETMDAARRFTREREQLRGNNEETAAEADVSQHVMPRTVHPDRKLISVTCIIPSASSAGLMITPPPIPHILPMIQAPNATRKQILCT